MEYIFKTSLTCFFLIFWWGYYKFKIAYVDHIIFILHKDFSREKS